ncbi:MAG: 4Fe-4S binding protein [Candidatus Paceibacterota bacterium]|jgi:ferredoxin
MYKINKGKCIGCGACVIVCPEGIKLGEDGKAEVIDQEKIKKCAVKDVCPYEAIEEDGKDN